MNTIGEAWWLYNQTGLYRNINGSKLEKMLPMPLREFTSTLPVPVSRKERKQRRYQYPAKGKQKAVVALFTGCIMDSVFFQTNENTIRLLNEAGAKVIIPEQQTCCGALHAHSGEAETAKELAVKNIEVFEQEEVDYIVNNAGGCGAQLVEYDHLFDAASEWKEKAGQFAEKSVDISRVLVNLGGLSELEARNEVVTYQPSCHLTHVQKETTAPLELLSSVPGITIRHMEDKDKCCGSAGIYNIVQHEESMKILDVKMGNTVNTKAQILITTNPGCYIQMKKGVERSGKKDEIRVMHLIDYLALRLPETEII